MMWQSNVYAHLMKRDPEFEREHPRIGKGRGRESGRFTRKPSGMSPQARANDKARRVQYEQYKQHVRDEGFVNAKVFFLLKRKFMSIGGERYECAATYTPSKDRFDFYPTAIGLSKKDRVALTAHEATHRRFSHVVSLYHLEQRLILDRVMKGEGIVDDAGRLVESERARYPVYNRMHYWFGRDGMQELENAGGVTKYSSSYWKNYREGDASDKNALRSTAVNETLAETSRLRAWGKRLPRKWGEALEALEEAYSYVIQRYPAMKSNLVHVVYLDADWNPTTQSRAHLIKIRRGQDVIFGVPVK